MARSRRRRHWMEAALRRQRQSRSATVADSSADALTRKLRHARAALKKSEPTRVALRNKPPRRRPTKIRGVVIGDLHDSPHIPDKSRGAWIGAYANALKPDFINQIGDFITADSLSRHPWPVISSDARPTWAEDIASFDLMLAAINAPLNWNCPKHCEFGNHELRATAFEQTHPDAVGTVTLDLISTFGARGWTCSQYGEIHYIDGVGFVHAALNRLGKAYAGKTAEIAIANDSVHDLVIGHSHVERMQRAPKIGGRHVSIMNVGCALPEGHIEPYARHALTGWSYGIMDITIQDGAITGRTWIPMTQLKERYGHVV